MDKLWRKTQLVANAAVLEWNKIEWSCKNTSLIEVNMTQNAQGSVSFGFSRTKGIQRQATADVWLHLRCYLHPESLPGKVWSCLENFQPRALALECFCSAWHIFHCITIVNCHPQFDHRIHSNTLWITCINKKIQTCTNSSEWWDLATQVANGHYSLFNLQNSQSPMLRSHSCKTLLHHLLRKHHLHWFAFICIHSPWHHTQYSNIRSGQPSANWNRWFYRFSWQWFIHWALREPILVHRLR